MNMSLTSISRSERGAARTDHVVAAILDVHTRLQLLTDLRPRPEVNEMFTNLVQLVVNTPEETATAALRDPRIRDIVPSLRRICADGETELEHDWSRRVATHPDPAGELARFPYVSNYTQLSRMELGVLASATSDSASSVTFVGGGPLPLSALMIAAESDATVEVIDHDPRAVAAAERMTRALGTDTISFQVSDAMGCDVSRSEVVILAALVGTSPQEKQHALDHLSQSMPAGSFLLARSSRGLRTLMYPSLPDDGLSGFDVLSVVHPVNDVINSAILARPQK